MDLKPGDIVGRMYTIDEAGPSGGMARIWRAWHRGLRTWHALKILDAPYAEDPEVRERFLAEGRIQAHYAHPHIVRVTDVIYEDKQLVLVMDWAAGGDLAAWMEANGLVSPAQAVAWTVQLLQALGFAHREGIVHRDVKPSNLMLNASGEILLTDFGVARVEDGRRTQVGTRMGTPDYMSPEQLRDAASVDGRADLFSAGAILYELITGEVATETPGLCESDMAGVPEDIAAVLRRALQPNPEDRFPDAASFIAALEPPSPLEVSPLETAEAVLAPPRRRSRRAWLVLAPLCLFLGASGTALGAWGWLGDDDGDGLGRVADACPDVPEDFDGFEDGDGCPETDNDADGVADEDDACPDVPEDLDGTADSDGCPDEDDDGDGVPDRSDACPAQPEDPDGFSDGDGCPDPDNDSDQLADAEDRCPDRAEVDNGLLDADGCPDPELALGEMHSCGLTHEGRVVCWGLDESGQGGSRPEAFLTLSAADDHSCGLTLAGDVLCWGHDRFGEAPALVTGPFLTVDTSEKYTCAVAAGGRIRCWGLQDEVVQQTPDETGFVSVSVALEHACALSAEGSISCWGRDTKGSLAAPTGRFDAVSAGGWHTCGLRKDRRLACWGYDADGQASPPSGRYIDVEAARWHSCGVRQDGLLRCWGFNGDGQAPEVLPGEYHSIALARRHGCAVRPSGEVVCWGDGSDGQTMPPNARGLFFPD